MSAKKVVKIVSNQEVSGRGKNGYTWLAGEIKKLVASGELSVGERVPTIRLLGDRYRVSRETARRAVRKLEAEGFFNADSKRCRSIRASAIDPSAGLPIAFVVAAAEKADLWDEFHRTLFACLQKAAAERGWSVLAVGSGRRSGREVMDQLRGCRACGMVLDAHNPDYIGEALRVGMPVVMMDAWEPEMRLDAVVQDSFQGALLGTQYLIGRGHKRIGWLGKISESIQAQERFGGFVSALTAAGLEMKPEFMRDTPWTETARAARELLSRPDRPTAVLGLWLDAAVELCRVASQLGLAQGRDVDILGWSAEESYADAYRAAFNGGLPPPTLVWSVTELARQTVSRLAQRRRNPDAAATIIKIPARLRMSVEGQ